VRLTTPGLGKGTFADTGHSCVPENLHPVAKIAFPAKEAGAPPIMVRAVLKER
jgi:hypothetical protein